MREECVDVLVSSWSSVSVSVSEYQSSSLDPRSELSFV
jgi:hypothetical protein